MLHDEKRMSNLESVLPSLIQPYPTAIRGACHSQSAADRMLARRLLDPQQGKVQLTRVGHTVAWVYLLVGLTGRPPGSKPVASQPNFSSRIDHGPVGGSTVVKAKHGIGEIPHSIVKRANHMVIGKYEVRTDKEPCTRR